MQMMRFPNLSLLWFVVIGTLKLPEHRVALLPTTTTPIVVSTALVMSMYNQRRTPLRHASNSYSIPEETKNYTDELKMKKDSIPTRNKRVAILVCPAQFCVPDDYNCLFDLLRNQSRWLGIDDNEDDNNDNNNNSNIEIGTCVTAPLPRTEWIKVARQIPTPEFWQAQLPVENTLRWYFDGIEAGLAEIFAMEGDTETYSVCMIGHSIGGWVARAYLGGLSRSSSAVHRMALERVSSLVTLGTPHTAPTAALVDQTRVRLLFCLFETFPICVCVCV